MGVRQRLSLRDHYKALPSQFYFHRSKAKIRLASGGVRSGKTVAGAVEFFSLCIQHPNSDLLILAPYWSVLNSVTLREFRTVLSWFPQLKYTENKTERYIELQNGARVYYASADKPHSFEGLTLSGFWADEARYYRKESWNVLIARLSCPKTPFPRGIVTTTPAMNWLFEEFMTGKEGREVLRFRTAQNHHLHSDYLQGLKESYSEKKYQQYVEGEFVQLEGSVFDDFSEDVHCVELPYIEGYPVDAIIDPGVRKAAALFGQSFDLCPIHRVRNCCHIIDEDMPNNTPTIRLAPRVAAKFAREGWRKRDLYIDTASRNRSVQTGIPDVYYFEKEGFNVKYIVDPTMRDIRNGIEAVQSKLRDNNGVATLYISKGLAGSKRGVVRALQSSTYPQDASGKPIGDVPTKDGVYEHARDTLRYYVVNKFGVGLPGIYSSNDYRFQRR